MSLVRTPFNNVQFLTEYLCNVGIHYKHTHTKGRSPMAKRDQSALKIKHTAGEQISWQRLSYNTDINLHLQPIWLTLGHQSNKQQIYDCFNLGRFNRCTILSLKPWQAQTCARVQIASPIITTVLGAGLGRFWRGICYCFTI